MKGIPYPPPAEVADERLGLESSFPETSYYVAQELEKNLFNKLKPQAYFSKWVKIMINEVIGLNFNNFSSNY